MHSSNKLSHNRHLYTERKYKTLISKYFVTAAFVILDVVKCIIFRVIYINMHIDCFHHQLTEVLCIQ